MTQSLLVPAIMAMAEARSLKEVYAPNLLPEGIGIARGRPFIKSWFSLCAYNPPSKYRPHQGKRECARRMAQSKWRDV